MDTELIKLLRAIKSGTIQEPAQVRQILGEAREAIIHLRGRLDKNENLLSDAMDAFVRGWEGEPSGTSLRLI